MADPRSKKIFENIEEWLKEMLRQIAKHDEFVTRKRLAR